MKILDRLFGKKKAKGAFVGERPDPTDNPPTERPTLTEPPSLPPKRIISEDVKLKKPKPKKRKKKITTKKGSVKKMAGEIVYEYVQCKCEDWKNYLPLIAEQQQIAGRHGTKYTGKPFVFCPWCGYKRYRSNRGKKASN